MGRHPHDRPAAARRLICVGAIAGAFGIHGQVRIRSFCAAPEAIAEYQPLYDGNGARQFRFRLTNALRPRLVAEMDGVTTREQAQELKGVRLFADRIRFPPAEPDEFYHADLIGLKVADDSGRFLGTVRNVVNFGAGDLLEVACDAGTARQIPFTRSAVPLVDLAGGRAVANWKEPEN